MEVTLHRLEVSGVRVASNHRSFSNFVVANPRDSDRSPMRARPLDPWAKFLLLVVLALVVFALAEVPLTP
jgi:hypothetical protein